VAAHIFESFEKTLHVHAPPKTLTFASLMRFPGASDHHRPRAVVIAPAGKSARGQNGFFEDICGRLKMGDCRIAAHCVSTRPKNYFKTEFSS
jgi:hypothetical protein